VGFLPSPIAGKNFIPAHPVNICTYDDFESFKTDLGGGLQMELNMPRPVGLARRLPGSSKKFSVASGVTKGRRLAADSSIQGCCGGETPQRNHYEHKNNGRYS
jgi:hypothetical protein